MPDSPGSLRELTRECHRLERQHRSAVRFYLLADLALALSSVVALKLDGPYYADAIVAGLFACGFGLSVYGYRVCRAAESELADAEIRLRDAAAGDAPVEGYRPGAGFLFILLAAFYLSASVATVWFSYVALRDANVAEEDAVASVLSHCSRNA